ncbi:ATP-binding sensor histidine kinase [Oscillatoria sp. FACHB-1406]|uniref:trifunctional serine/threonine-protein kinase/ATP-binding protein/sensor histidine kinase n=1 Tax=Oscillatoria sp. FACHB-1406 TaxID=2692846 RepID=UPI0018EF6E3D|nr:ATP-binding sensor histidine kinase [Oscillatoria sp. FACHB-1406]
MAITLHLDGYLLSDNLYQGSRTLVYRAIRQFDKKPVILKFLRNPYPSFSELVQFRNQYTIAQNLNLPGIVKPLALESYGNGYALVMPDEGYISLEQWLKGQVEISLEQYLILASQLAEILHGLGQNRVIHKDIKPANILIHPDSKQLQLIDFSIASLLPKETQEIKNPNVLEGTLAYISPEQTGRMNRGIDYRSDFYALGVTLFELLTGELPFQATDPMELVHCHLAKTPPDLGKTQKIPQVLANIVMKLMAKNAENRYQSALGLKHDLETCLYQLQETGKIENFAIAQHDICDRFIIPEKLYGREVEIAQLLAAFDRVAEGNTELMLVAGFSGIGKTAVVNEVHKPIVRQRGYFIKGKFDQFNRNIPFSAFVQAFRNLIGQLLGESDAQLAVWKTKIIEAVGENGQVIIDVIPELETIIGKQLDVPELSGSAAQNRFNLLFQKFVGVFAQKEHPLTLFIDDLQWADSASLELLKYLMNDARYLLVLGAYRDNEVSPAHPLMLALDKIVKSGTISNTITLRALSVEDTNQLIADTLNCESAIARPLTEIVARKTQGNPFFTTQFLKALYQEGAIEFDRELSYWQCDLTQVQALALTDDVVEFMAAQLQKLPNATQTILKLAACIGAQFDLDTLAIVSEQSQIEASTALWAALIEGLILPQNDVYKFYQDASSIDRSAQTTVSYKFLHDRVQQAAYSLIPDEQKQITHYQIGQLLLQQISSEAREERIFELLDQLNHGTSLITQPTQGYELAKLNLIASRKARSATAYQAGREYTNIGLSLLGEQAWQQQYELTLEFHELTAEFAFLCGDFAVMEQFIETVIEQAHTLLEKVNVYRIKIQFKTSQSQLDEVLALGMDILQQLGIPMTEAPTMEDVQQSIQEISTIIGNQKVEDFAEFPVMTDANTIAITQIASSIMAAAYTCGSLLYPLLTTLLVKLSLQYGNTSVSAANYACYSLVLSNIQKDIDLAAQFGQLALNLVLKFDAKATKPEVFLLLGGFILHRKYHIKETLPFLEKGYTLGLEIGNLEYVGYCGQSFCRNSFYCGLPLSDLEQNTRTYYHALVQLKQLGSANYCLIYWQMILNLLGFAERPTILSGSALQETEFLPLLRAANDWHGLYMIYIYKLILCLLFGEIEEANNHAVECRNYFMGGASTVGEPAFYLYDSLVSIAKLTQSADEISTTLERVEQNQTLLQQWANHAPMNHQHKYDLVEAEKYRVLGKYYKAGDWYDRAIQLAKENEYIQEEALANELAAKFYLDWGKEKVAAGYMQEAYYCYARWGAKAKTDRLEKCYPQLLQPILQQRRLSLNPRETIAATTVTSTSTGSSHSSSSISDALDFASVLKAAQAISSSIELDELMANLTRILLENSGAKKSALILLQAGNLQVRAITSVDRQENSENDIKTVLNSHLLETYTDLPKPLIYYVKNTQKTVVIDRLKTEVSGIIGHYMLTHQPQSVCCTPIMNQGKLVGIIYLENQYTGGVFTSDRLQSIDLLCTQSAISLENAQLYSNLQASEARFLRLAENAPGMIYQFQLSPEGIPKFNYVSPGCYGIYEIFPEEVEADADRLLSLTHPEDVAYFQESVAMSAQTLESWQYQGRVITRSGKLKWVQASSNPIKETDGTIIWDGLLLDITNRKQAEIAVKQKSQELETALLDLQQAQLQIVQSEKMSALGNLVAGVAHEINNPVGFISGNINEAIASFADLTEYLQLYHEKFPHPGYEIEEKAEELDINYLLSDFPKMLNSIELGCARIQNISTSLRTFSRADKDYKVTFNIHEGIDSTLLILKHRLKANENRPDIEVVTQYDHLPPIECFPGQLNQVFMNILANAIDALDESNIGRSFADIKANPNQIIIQTSGDDRQVEITIADNGIGMSEEIQQKVFEHLFTTKAVGKGTGLGLAIARQIVVEKHGGSITFSSQPGEETVFKLLLPIQG